MNHAQIKKTVNDLVIRYQTRDPFRIACALQYQILFEHVTEKLARTSADAMDDLFRKAK